MRCRAGEIASTWSWPMARWQSIASRPMPWRIASSASPWKLRTEERISQRKASFSAICRPWAEAAKKRASK